jgi:hypothetical protein
MKVTNHRNVNQVPLTMGGVNLANLFTSCISRVNPITVYLGHNIAIYNFIFNWKI